MPLPHLIPLRMQGFAAAILVCAALGFDPALASGAPVLQISTPTALPPVPVPNPTAVPSQASARFHDNTGKLAAPPFATLADFGQATNGVAQGKDGEAFWKAVLSTKQMPLIFGNTAVFLYRGKATSVDWRGDFTRWNSLPALRGRRLGVSDIWVATKTFPADARLDYKVVLNGNRQILDPLNTFTQLGAYGRYSVLRMPSYVYPVATLPGNKTVSGKLGDPKLIASKHLGYAVRYRVYTPAGYEKMKDLPAIYATDGQEYADSEMGALPIVLDNLIAAGTIRPVIAVFVDPRDTGTGANRRGPELLTNDRYEAFMVRELVPAIEAAYPVSRSAANRALLGASLGGLRGIWAIMKYPDQWGMAALQSPYFKAKPRVLALFAESKRLPVKVFVNQGTYDLDVEGTRFLRDVLKAKGYDYRYVETNDGHSWGNWRGQLEEMLIFFLGRSPGTAEP